MVPELVGKYIFLVQVFVEAGDRGLSLQEVARKWEDRYGTAYPRRTFLNHRSGVEEVFGIAITCDRSTNRYRICEASSAVDRQEAVNYLIDTFTVNSLLTLGKERLSGRVSVEEIPSGGRYLTSVMQALLDNAELRITYRKYLSEEEDVRLIRPYALKEFEKRWYVVAYSLDRSALRVFALDRIMALERTGETFRMPAGFRVEELFGASFGIYLPEGEAPVLVKLRTTLREAAYLEDLPLHPSQLLVRREADHCLFALRVIPNPDFVMELLRHGNRLEVLEPASLRETVQKELEQALALYET